MDSGAINNQLAPDVLLKSDFYSGIHRSIVAKTHENDVCILDRIFDSGHYFGLVGSKFSCEIICSLLGPVEDDQGFVKVALLD